MSSFFTLSIRVQPGARRPGVERQSDGSWKVKLRARAVEGQANKALVEQLAEWLEVPKSSVRIVRGETSRQKVIAVAGLAEPDAARRLEALVAAG